VIKGEIIDAIAELVQDDSAAMRGILGRWVNIVLDDLAARGYLNSLKREETTSLIAGDGVSMIFGRDYSLASDTDKVYKVFIPAAGIDGILTGVSEDHFLRLMLRDGPVGMGLPQFYTIFGTQTLRLHPIPSAQWAPASPTDLEKLYIWKYKDIAHLQEADDITDLRPKHQPLLIRGAYAFGCRFDELGDYATTKAEYEKAVVDFFFDQNRQPDRPKQTEYRDW
jgi:hypothetical protein